MRVSAVDVWWWPSTKENPRQRETTRNAPGVSLSGRDSIQWRVKPRPRGGRKKKPNFPISKAEGTHGWRRAEGKKGKGRKGE